MAKQNNLTRRRAEGEIPDRAAAFFSLTGKYFAF